jgi:hypothetical protein
MELPILTIHADFLTLHANLYSIVIVLFWVHVLADFVLQSDWMATNKSKSLLPLTTHVMVYSIPFALLFGWRYALINMGAHFITDFFTSRMTSYLWKREKRHEFFVVIGIDQAIHLTTLVYTLRFVV